MPTKQSKPQHRVTKPARAARPKRSPLPQPSTTDDDPSSPVYFWRETEPLTGYLSQWYPCAFSDDTDSSTIYKTAEHYMMYQKAVLFSDPAMGAEILAAEHPRLVKALGRKVANFDGAVWNKHREAIVHRGNVLKFTRPVDTKDGKWAVRVPGTDGGESEGVDRSIKELLLGTGDRELVEASPRDRIWGVGFGAARAGSMRAKWGLNLLGKALVSVREELKKEAEEGGEEAD
ncbi:hypothetical protein B0J18DRAFT_6692 [Chaetomium sp. MPI-SDFR-AT-0129]|nr:hypothetical protein B0J18DRAFT_6692 [Chaetomium sp. MPI-SDFR-AT-0129]